MTVLNAIEVVGGDRGCVKSDVEQLILEGRDVGVLAIVFDLVDGPHVRHVFFANDALVIVDELLDLFVTTHNFKEFLFSTQ